MQIHIHAITNQPDSWLKEAEQCYLQRIHKPYLIEVHYKSISKHDKNRSSTEIKAAEAKLLLQHTQPNDFLCYLDAKGKSYTSEEFAITLNHWREQHTCIRFMLGGAEGHDPKALANAHSILSLSDMTLAHGFARVLLVEQIYRAIMIQNKHPYHK